MDPTVVRFALYTVLVFCRRIFRKNNADNVLPSSVILSVCVRLVLVITV